MTHATAISALRAPHDCYLCGSSEAKPVRVEGEYGFLCTECNEELTEVME